MHISKEVKIGLLGTELCGTIPSKVGLFKQHLVSFVVSHTYLEGHIPQSIGNCSNLIDFELNENYKLTDGLQTTLGLLSELQYHSI